MCLQKPAIDERQASAFKKSPSSTLKTAAKIQNKPPILTSEDQKMLEDSFMKNPYPDHDDLMSLAEQLGRNFGDIHTWFHMARRANRR